MTSLYDIVHNLHWKNTGRQDASWL